MEITGVVQSIIFRNTDNGYTVLSLFDEEKNADFTACGALPLCSVGDTVRLEGSLKFHPRYGQQFAAAKCEVLAPSTLGAIESYLSSGTVKGIGPAMARILVNTFGMDTLRIMEEEPRRLLEIPGIVTTEPQGAFYTMAKLPVDSTERFQLYLLQEFEDNGETVMFAPGSGFYATPGAGTSEIRIAYVRCVEELERSLTLLRLAIERYNQK